MEIAQIRNDMICDDCIFVGSGDSYVAGLVAEYLTDHRSKCYSPSDLAHSGFKDRTKTYCFISVTGKTKSNIMTAKSATDSGAKTVAVTFDNNSKLAQTCKEIITVDVKRPTTPTAGLGSFVANVVTCLQLAGISIPDRFIDWYNRGSELSVDLIESDMLPQDRTLYLLGNNIMYAVSLYTSFQLAEFFACKANAYKLEEFCHSPIFGLKKLDYVWILGQSESAISQRLDPLGLNLSYFELGDNDPLSQLFESIFFVQNLILLLAEKQGCTELQYVLKKDILKASTDIIY
jgi:fructoselysine-6-P-deglycase FrlB-like protein